MTDKERLERVFAKTGSGTDSAVIIGNFGEIIEDEDYEPRVAGQKTEPLVKITETSIGKLLNAPRVAVPLETDPRRWDGYYKPPEKITVGYLGSRVIERVVLSAEGESGCWITLEADDGTKANYPLGEKYTSDFKGRDSFYCYPKVVVVDGSIMENDQVWPTESVELGVACGGEPKDLIFLADADNWVLGNTDKKVDRPVIEDIEPSKIRWVRFTVHTILRKEAAIIISNPKFTSQCGLVEITGCPGVYLDAVTNGLELDLVGLKLRTEVGRLARIRLSSDNTGLCLPVEGWLSDGPAVTVMPDTIYGVGEDDDLPRLIIIKKAGKYTIRNATPGEIGLTNKITTAPQDVVSKPDTDKFLDKEERKELDVLKVDPRQGGAVARPKLTSDERDRRNRADAKLRQKKGYGEFANRVAPPVHEDVVGDGSTGWEATAAPLPAASERWRRPGKHVWRNRR